MGTAKTLACVREIPAKIDEQERENGHKEKRERDKESDERGHRCASVSEQADEEKCR